MLDRTIGFYQRVFSVPHEVGSLATVHSPVMTMVMLGTDPQAPMTGVALQAVSMKDGKLAGFGPPFVSPKVAEFEIVNSMQSL